MIRSTASSASRIGLAVGVDAPVGVPGVRVAPGDHEHLLALPTRYSTRLRPGARSIDVVLVDHRRDDQQRGRRTVSVCGVYWISSNISVRSTTAPGVTARSTPDPNASGVDHGRHPRRGGHVARRSCAAPRARSPRPCRWPPSAPPGSAAGCSRRQRLDQVVDQEADPLAVAPVQLGVGHQLLGGPPGGQVGLQRAGAAAGSRSRPGRRSGGPASPGRPSSCRARSGPSSPASAPTRRPSVGPGCRRQPRRGTQGATRRAAAAAAVPSAASASSMSSERRGVGGRLAAVMTAPPARVGRHRSRA